ncbi:MAG: hypothetical protein IH876_01010 [Gemmatimonadetes bacterium]|nr:hypothetical protein [Gemmatimonadota bacterium]
MKSFVGCAAALALAVGLVVAPAAAQLNSIPVYFNPKGGTGFTLAGDFGKGVNTQSGKNTAFGVRASVGGGPFSIGAGVGTVSLAGQSEVQYMGNAALRIVGGPLIPVSVAVQAGVGYLKVASVKTLNIPIGIGIGLSVPTPGFSFDPWIAPRVTVNAVEILGITTTNSGVGVSGGVNLAFVMGLGLHLGFDWTKVGGSTPLIIGAGVHYKFGPPGIPVVPGA